MGGAGFMGSHLVELLVAEGVPVRVFDLPGCADRRLAGLAGKIEVVEGDFQGAAAVAAAVSGCEAVFHLIGTTVPATANRDPLFDLETNVAATVRLLEACSQAGVKRVVFSSSGGTVYGDAQQVPIPETHATEPQSAYGITKLAVEKYLALFERLHGLNYTVLRISNAYGPRGRVDGRQGVMGAFLKALKHGQAITLWGEDAMVRDYVYVEDVARAFRAALRQQSPHRVFNIGTGVGTSLRELIALMERVTGRRVTVRQEPGGPTGVRANVLDASRAREHLGWQPTTTLEAGLRKTWEWIQAAEV